MNRNLNEAINLLNSLGDNSRRTRDMGRRRVTLLETVFNNPYEQNERSYDTGDDYDMQDNKNDYSPMKGQLPSEQQMDPEIEQMLNSIRLSVIKGLAKLAQRPDSQEYDLLKKILVLIDKPVEVQNKVQGK